jgi:Permuted papain-like amidase enzyme, YaeF/YiiX, C92 family
MKSFQYSLFAAIFFFFYACGGTPPNFSSDIRVLNKEMIAAAKNSIRTGDIVLRSGKDFTSYRIRELSDKDKTYSHAGMAYVDGTNVYIYHITPPDLDEDKADTILRLETLEQFAKPAKCFGFGVARYKLSEDEIGKSIHYLDSLRNKKITFDYVFDLREPGKMYCSEMIDNTLRYATAGRIALARKFFTKQQSVKAVKYFHLTMQDVMKREYIPIDNIYMNPYCTVIQHYVFLK